MTTHSISSSPLSHHAGNLSLDLDFSLKATVNTELGNDPGSTIVTVMALSLNFVQVNAIGCETTNRCKSE